MEKIHIYILLFISFSIQLFANEEATDMLGPEMQNSNKLIKYTDKYQKVATGTNKIVGEIQKYWSYNIVNTDTKKEISFKLDLGLGDRVFPGAEQKVIDKLNKTFDPVVESLEEFKMKNIEHFNSDGFGKEVSRVMSDVNLPLRVMRWLGIDEDLKNKVFASLQCEPEAQTSESSGGLCLANQNYNLLGDKSILHNLQEKIKETKTKIMNSYVDNIESKLNEQIEKVREWETNLKNKNPLLFKPSSFELKIEKDLGLDLQGKIKKEIARGCNKLLDKSLGTQQSIETGEDSVVDSGKRIMRAYCDSSLGADGKYLYDVVSSLKGLSSLNTSASFYYKGVIESKETDMCKLMENLFNDSGDDEGKRKRAEAKKQLQQTVEKLHASIMQSIVQIIATQVIAAIPKLLIQKLMVDIPICAIVATVRTNTMGESSSENDDSGETESGVMDALTSLKDGVSNVFSSFAGGNSSNEGIKKALNCYKEKVSKLETGDEKDMEVGGGYNTFLSTIAVFGKTIGMFTGGIMLDIGGDAKTNITARDESETLKDCINENTSQTFKDAFQKCLEGKDEDQIMLGELSLLPILQKLNFLKKKVMKKQCLLDRKDFKRPLKNEQNKAVNINLNYFTDQLPKLINTDNQDTMAMGNLFVLKQKLIKSKVEFNSFVKEAMTFKRFYEKEYDFMLGDNKDLNLKTMYHKNALCYIAYDDDIEKTNFGNKSDNILKRVFKDKTYNKSECLNEITNYSYSEKNQKIVNNTPIATFAGESVRKYSVGGYLEKDDNNQKTGRIVYKNGLNMYCHKLAIDINKSLKDIKTNYIDKKYCVDTTTNAEGKKENKKGVSCTKSSDCNGSQCVSLLYISEETKNDAKLGLYRQAIGQVVHCIDLTERIKGTPIEEEKEEVRVSYETLRQMMGITQLKVKLGLISQKEAKKETLLQIEYRKIFQKKLEIDPKYIEETCRSIEEPKDPFNTSMEYLMCKEYKIKLQQQIHNNLHDHKYKVQKGTLGDDVERIYDEAKIIEIENEILKQKLMGTKY